jgi:hypothetical protein
MQKIIGRFNREPEVLVTGIERMKNAKEKTIYGKEIDKY